MTLNCKALQLLGTYITMYHSPRCNVPDETHLQEHRCKNLSPSVLYFVFHNEICCMLIEEKPTRCHWMVYCTYNMLNMFRAILCPSSEAWNYTCFITADGVRCLGCWLLEVRYRAAGCPAPNLKQPATKASHTIGGNNTHTVSSSWWWA